jgi:hypothetical protein
LWDHPLQDNPALPGSIIPPPHRIRRVKKTCPCHPDQSPDNVFPSGRSGGISSVGLEEWIRALPGLAARPDSSDHGKWPDEGPSSYDFPSSDEWKGLEVWNYGLIGISCLSGTIRKTPSPKVPVPTGSLCSFTPHSRDSVNTGDR